MASTSARLMKMAKNRNKFGFSLLEMLVVIAIIAMVMGVAVVRLSGVLGIDMKRATNRFASTIRYVYNFSITKNLYVRLVCDLEKQAYYIEATRDPYRVDKDVSFSDIEGKEKEKGSEKAGSLERLEPAPVSFSEAQSKLLKPTALPKGVFFKDVYVEHMPMPVEAGKVAIHFFPNGRVERAIINLRDKDDSRNYSLSINPMTGDTGVAWEYKKLEKSEGK